MVEAFMAVSNQRSA